MTLRALLVISAAACVFARDIPLGDQHGGYAQPSSTDEIDEKDLCRREIPTEACEKKCEDKEMEPYCYKHTRECLCRPKKVSNDPSASYPNGMANENLDASSSSITFDQGAETNETSLIHHIIILLFPPMSDEEELENSDQKSGEPSQGLSADMSVVPVTTEDFLWSKERLAMVLMAAVILALVTVELCIMYRKRRSAHYLDDVFKTTHLDDKLVKSFKEEVRGC